MWVLHSWSPWLTHSNTFLKWHSYFNTIIFIYSFKISLNHSSGKKNNAEGRINSWSYTIWFSTVWEGGEKTQNKQKNQYIFYMESQQKEQRVEWWTLYNLQFSNNHHNIAVNVTLNLSLKVKYTVNPRQVYSTATRKKCQRTQKDRSHSFTLELSFALIYTTLTHSNVSYTQPQS